MTSDTRLRWAALAAALIAVILPFAARALAGEEGALVNVRWQPSLSDSERHKLEARFRLADGQRLDAHTWRYDLVEPSRDNIRTLIADGSVADTQGIDRPNAALEAGTARTARRQRFQTYGDRLVALSDRVAIVLAVIVTLAPLVSWTRQRPVARALWLGVRRQLQAPPGGTPLWSGDDPGDRRSWLWTAAVVAAAAPAVITLCLTLWHSPFAISEVVAMLEDVEERPLAFFFDPNKAYYRPLSNLVLATIWHHEGGLGARLAGIKLLTIVPVVSLVGLLIWHFKPRTALEAVAASLALTVVIGSAGFRDNLEMGMWDGIAGMAIAMGVWMVLTHERRPWHTPILIACTLFAVGTREQGLVLVPLVVAAWWTGAPGVSRRVAIGLGAFGIAYVAFRLAWRTSWLPFEQDIGLGFTEIPLEEAAVRFGAFPYWVYLYSSASTVLSLLFAEPRRGVFRVVHSWLNGEIQPWQLVQVGSSLLLTTLVTWWGVRSFRDARARGAWTRDSSLLACAVLVVLVTGCLSFNYSRERLTGFGVVFYALAAFSAVRAAAARTLTASRAGFVAGSLALAILAGAWHIRAFGTLEWVRGQSSANRQEWLVTLAARRVEYAHRTVYVRIMESMVEQGADPAAPRSTRFPDWISRVVGSD